MHSVLVTGGAGYIGSHMVQALRRAGYRTVVLDNLSEGHRAAVQDADLVEESLADRAVLRAVLLRHRPSAILHFAASSRVEESVENPILYYKNNLVGTLNLLEAALEAGVLRFVYSSTCSVYGEPQEVPITEEHPTVPINPYGWSKLASERLLAETARAYGMRYVVFRYFNAAGAEPKAKLGEDHRPETHLIPLALRSAVFQDQDLEIYGKDYPTPDGTCVRDYIHVLDLVDAHLQGLRHLEEEGDNIVLNLGTETGFSVIQVLEAVERVTGLAVPHRFGKRRPGDPAVLVASNRKAKEILGWEPTRSLDDMIRSAYDFLRYRPEGYPAISEFGRMMEPEPQPEMD
jgi:UDP-glucose 4-epimerase